MARSMKTIHGITRDGLNDYNPEAFDAIPQADGTFNLVPVRWMNQAEYNTVQYGCGHDEPEEKTDSNWEAEAIQDAEADKCWDKGPGAK